MVITGKSEEIMSRGHTHTSRVIILGPVPVSGGVHPASRQNEKKKGIHEQISYL